MASILVPPRQSGPRLIEEPYHIPKGAQDFPFCYLFDASGLTDGSITQNIVIQLQGDSTFILRRIAGVNLCVASAASGGRWNYRNASQSYALGNPSTGCVAYKNWTVVPEKKYGPNDQIAFDLYDVLRTSAVATEGTIYQSFIGFFGVKRFAEGMGYATAITRYPYREFPQIYTFPLTINWGHFTAAGLLQGPRTFWLQMDNYDFELLGISITAQGSAGALSTPDFAITLYNPSKFAFSNLPVLQMFYNRGKPTSATQPPYNGTGPVPSIVYPAGSQIQFDITSLLANAALPVTYNIDFQGIWRLPCAGRNPGF
jgi:hypothetical protein